MRWRFIAQEDNAKVAERSATLRDLDLAIEMPLSGRGHTTTDE